MLSNIGLIIFVYQSKHVTVLNVISVDNVNPPLDEPRRCEILLIDSHVESIPEIAADDLQPISPISFRIYCGAIQIGKPENHCVFGENLNPRGYQGGIESHIVADNPFHLKESRNERWNHSDRQIGTYKECLINSMKAVRHSRMMTSGSNTETPWCWK